MFGARHTEQGVVDGLTRFVVAHPTMLECRPYPSRAVRGRPLLNRDIQRLFEPLRITEQFLHNPVRVEVARPATTVSTITQQLVKTGREPHDKRDTLRRLIRSADNFKNAIVFCNRKREGAQLHRSLVRHGFNAAALHGDMDQSARTAALDSFRKGDVALLDRKSTRLNSSHRT